MGRGWGGVCLNLLLVADLLGKKEATACKPYNSRGEMREGEECACHESFPMLNIALVGRRANASPYIHKVQQR